MVASSISGCILCRLEASELKQRRPKLYQRTSRLIKRLMHSYPEAFRQHICNMHLVKHPHGYQALISQRKTSAYSATRCQNMGSQNISRYRDFKIHSRTESTNNHQKFKDNNGRLLTDKKYQARDPEDNWKNILLKKHILRLCKVERGCKNSRRDPIIAVSPAVQCNFKGDVCKFLTRRGHVDVF